MKLQVTDLHSSQLSLAYRKIPIVRLPGRIFVQNTFLVASRDGPYYRKEFFVSKILGLTFRQDLKPLSL